MSTRDDSPSGWRAPLTWMLLGALALSALVLRPLALELGTGVVLGYVSERPIAWTLGRLGKADRPRWRWAVTVGFVTLAALVLLVPASLAVWVAVNELVRLVQSLTMQEVERVPAALNGLLARRLGVSPASLPTAELALRGRGVLESMGAWLARTTGRALSAAPMAGFSAFVVVSAWATFAARGPALRAAVLPKLIPWAREREILCRTTSDVIEGVVLANLGVSAVQAAIISVATLALRVPHAIVWGVVSFVLSFVPLVGTSLVTGSAALYLFVSGRVVSAVVMAVVAVVAGSIDNVLRPILARSGSRLPFLGMLAAFFGGLTVFGPAGVILGPLVFAWAAALWEAHESQG